MPDYTFPNFQVPPGTFPFDNLPQQLQRTFTAMPTASYGRWNGTGVTQGLGYPAGINPGPPAGYPQGGGLLGGGPAPNPGGGGGLLGGSPPTPTPQPAPQPAHDLGPVIAQRIEAMRQRAQAYQNSGPSLDQFKATFNSLPEAERFVYWNSLPGNGAGAIDQYLSTVPGFRSWVNEMFNNYAGGSLAGKKWDFANNRIMQ